MYLWNTIAPVNSQFQRWQGNNYYCSTSRKNVLVEMHMYNEKALADTVEEFNRAAGTEWNLTFQSTEW